MAVKFTQQSVQEAAKANNLSVNAYLDKLPDSFLQDAATQNKLSIPDYRQKLKGVWGEPIEATEIGRAHV